MPEDGGQKITCGSQSLCSSCGSQGLNLGFYPEHLPTELSGWSRLIILNMLNTMLNNSKTVLCMLKKY